MGRARSNGLALVAIFVVATAALTLVRLTAGPSTPADRGGSGAPVPVALATVEGVEFVDRLDAIGTARSNESVTITAKVTETVRKVTFMDGQLVQVGDILVELTDEEEAANLSGAQSAYEEASKNFERISQLTARGMASAAQLDAARTARDNAKARVDAIAAQLADRLIRAPFAGVLGLRNISPGTLVRPRGDVITTLDDISTVSWSVHRAEVYLATLAPSMRLEAHAPAFEEHAAFEGRFDRHRHAHRSPDANRDGARACSQSRHGAQAGHAPRFDHPQHQDRARGSRAGDRRLAGPALRLPREGRQGRARRGQDRGAPGRPHRDHHPGLTPGDKIVSDGVHRVRPGQRLRVMEIDGKPAEAPTKRQS
ncbi:MAG: efflux RND transporter periplasmic adaptor subunit [Alphaproteobacteria bacterium]